MSPAQEGVQLWAGFPLSVHGQSFLDFNSLRLFCRFGDRMWNDVEFISPPPHPPPPMNCAINLSAYCLFHLLLTEWQRKRLNNILWQACSLCCFMENPELYIVSVIKAKGKKKKVMIMFSVVGDRVARMTRYTINHSDEEGGRQGCRGKGLGWGGFCRGWGVRGQWQSGKVMWAELLACGEAPPSRYHTITLSGFRSLFFLCHLLLSYQPHFHSLY